MRYIFIIINLLNIFNVLSFKISYIKPNKITKDFASQIDVHYTKVGIEDSYLNSKELMLHIGYIHQNHDRIPPEHGYLYCLNNHNKIVRDWSYQERFFYSCCDYIKKEKGLKIYNCPIPPAEIDPDPFRTLFTDDVTHIYYKYQNNNSKWTLSDHKFTYHNELSISGFLKKLLSILFLFFIFAITSNSLIGLINDCSNKHPRITTITHITLTIFTFVLLIILIENLEDNPKDQLKKYGIQYSIITLLYSLFIIYIPSKKNDLYSNTIDQRVTINSKSEYLYKIINYFKKRQFKNLFSFIFILLIFFQIWAIYSILDCMKENFDLEVEILITTGILLVILSFIYIIAFITGIYDINIPIKINKNGTITEVTNFKNQILKNRINPNNNNKFVGFCHNETFIDYNIDLIKENDLLVIDTDFKNFNTKYNYIIWKIGHLEKNKIIIDERVLVDKKTKGCINKKYGKIKIYKRGLYESLNIYVVIKPKKEKSFGYVHYGHVKNNYIYKNHNFFIKFISFVFKLIPEHDEKYNYNIVDNLRTEFYKITYKSCVKYGIIYWILFVITSFFTIFYEVFIGTNYINIVMIITMIFYVINVNIRLFKIPIIKKQNSKIYSLLNQLKSNTRGDINYNIYRSNTTLLKNSNIKNFYFNKESINKEMEYIDLNKSLKKKSFFEITCKNKNNIIGIGISKNRFKDDPNIFYSFTTGFWFIKQDNNLGVFNKNEFLWLKEKEILEDIIKIRVGLINKKLIYISPNNNSYCCEIKNKNLLLIFNKEIENLEIKELKLNVNLNNEINFIPKYSINKSKEILFHSDTNKNNIIFKSETNWDEEILISYKNNKKIYNWLLNKKISIESPISIESEVNNYDILRNGLIVLLKNYKFNKDMMPKEVLFELEVNTPNDNIFCVIGLIEERDLNYNKYINIVPGWRGSYSIGYHSDDGSIIFSNSNSLCIKKSDIIKYNLKTKNILSIGYNGEDIYFGLNNKYFYIEENFIDRWNENYNFIPILYIDGLNILDYKIKIKI
jgi:hypothetical protein